MITEEKKAILKRRRSFTLEAPFINACAENNLELVEYILFSPDLNEHPNVTCRNYQALRDAANQGSYEVIEFLLNSPEINKKEELIKARKQVLIRNACHSGNIKLVKYLLETPGIKEHIDFSVDKYKPFEESIYSFNKDLVIYLYDKYKNNMKDKYTYLTDLFKKVYKEECMTLAKELLSHDDMINYFVYAEKYTTVTELINKNKKEDLDFLLSHEKLQNSVRKVMDYGSVMVALSKTNLDMLHLVIVKHEIEQTETIKQFLDNPVYDTENMRKMFEKRSLYKKLSNKYEDLPEQRKNKI